MGRHTQQGSFNIATLAIAQFYGVFLLVERERTVAAKLNTYQAVIVAHLHVRRHLALGVECCVGSNNYFFKGSPFRLHRH